MSIRSSALGLVLALAACQSPRSAQQPGAPAQQQVNPQAPVAKVGVQTITAAQLDDTIKKDLKQLDQQYQEQVYELKRRALEQMIQKQVFEAKAKAVGVSVDDLIDREVVQKIPEPSDAEVKSLYDAAVAQGQKLPPLAQVKPNIVRFIKNQKGQEVLAKYYDGLRKDAGVEVLLPAYVPPKVEVAATGPAKGAADAPVTIVEFSDYQCPYCVRAEPTVKEVVAAYPGKIRLVYRDYPLPGHSLAPKAAEAAHCAGDQGKYWEMHDRLFAAQGKLDVADLKGYAKDVGLDPAKFDKCLDSGEKASEVAFHKKAGEEAGVNGTPAFFINGRLISGAQPAEAFKQVIDSELQGAEKTAKK
ncbi:thioredoxin domain-containing protein [Anaeromyxobacter oryzae]|uniref:Oxidoreductase n=1 Tax=Anaeromyxobacter oryzae TaxID=2918170 RepID=A0ABN6MSV4_9BACT|nr:thioredoxin domain-containing protein [Anaeromyxobacter oryzae]BDG04073.1 oxidoreductase [Anaeromyxobacter oryzae]